ncbi:unnamed protein product [Lampetra fluviatilis]
MDFLRKGAHTASTMLMRTMAVADETARQPASPPASSLPRVLSTPCHCSSGRPSVSSLPMASRFPLRVYELNIPAASVQRRSSGAMQSLLTSTKRERSEVDDEVEMVEEVEGVDDEVEEVEEVDDEVEMVEEVEGVEEVDDEVEMVEEVKVEEEVEEGAEEEVAEGARGRVVS